MSIEWKPIETAPKDGTEVLVCMAVDADGKRIGSSFGLFVMRAAWWAEENGGNGAWICYCSMINDPEVFFEPTHFAEIGESPK